MGTRSNSGFKDSIYREIVGFSCHKSYKQRVLSTTYTVNCFDFLLMTTCSGQIELKDNINRVTTTQIGLRQHTQGFDNLIGFVATSTGLFSSIKYISNI